MSQNLIIKTNRNDKWKIIAIWWGHMKKWETLHIDKEVVRLTEKRHPKVLFIPTASKNNEKYIDTFVKQYKKLGCEVDVLYLNEEEITSGESEEKIMDANAVYIWGWNTLNMMKKWRKYKIDEMLIKAYRKGCVMAWFSAGAIAFFKYWTSTSLKQINPRHDYIRVRGLWFLSNLVCPHFDSEAWVKLALKLMMSKTSWTAIALDDGVAIEVINDTYRIISQWKNKKAYKTFFKEWEYFVEEIEQTQELRFIKNLLKK